MKKKFTKLNEKKKLIIDGYNVIYKIPELKKALDVSLEKARNELALYLSKWKSERKFHGQICVVFDGKSEIYSDSVETCRGIKFIFSSTTAKADNEIISILKTVSSPNNIIVVTDDNYIKNHCRVYHAGHKFVSFLVTNVNSKNLKEELSKPTISHSEQERINKDLKDIWGIT